MKTKHIFIAALSALAFTACEDDFLNEEPKLKQSTELTLSTIDGIQKSVAGSYAYLSASYWYGADFITDCELRACNARKPSAQTWDSGRCKSGNDWSYSSASSMAGLWTYAYKLIDNANEILDNVDGKAEQTVVDGVRAEALFLRALAHFDLVRTFAQPYAQTDPAQQLGVPVMLHSQNGTPARNTVAEVYDQIVADLTEAEKIMPEKYNAAYHQAVADKFAVASKEAIQALLSRVYLYMGQWQKAADYATLVINSGKFNLWSKADLAKAYVQDVAADGGEVIFEVYGDQGNDRFSVQNWEYLMWMSSPRGSGDFGASHDVYDLYEEDDARLGLFVTADKANGQYWSTKYAGKDNSSPSYNNTIVLRLSEMYLNRAEAIFRGASVSGVTAQSDLLAITKVRGASMATPTETGIFTERRKELAFEGHIVYDFARFGRNLTRGDIMATLKEVPFPNYRWALPIPKSEMDANPNMVQNPGY